jgi:uncharacterized protein
MLGAIVVVLALVALLLALLWTLQRRLIYLPFPAVVPPAVAVLGGARELTLRTADGLALGAWFVAPAGPGRGMAVLVAAGNAGNRSLRAPLAAALAREGLSVLLFDYRGYGGNRGRPTEAGLARDVRAALGFLREEVGIPRDRILYYGESLGAAVVAELAAEHPPSGTATRSPSSSPGSRFPRQSCTAPTTGSCRPARAAWSRPPRPARRDSSRSRAPTTTMACCSTAPP